MEKIVIIGPGGAGKTTLAQKLGSILNINVVHLDRILWQRDWKEIPRDTRIDIIQILVQEKQWIIDGTYLSTSELHLEAADTIILMDISPLVCLLRIIKRHKKFEGRSRRDIPMGSTDKLTLFLILKVLSFPFQGSRTIKQNLRTHKSKQIFWLRSLKEVKDFLANLDLMPTKRVNFLRSIPL